MQKDAVAAVASNAGVVARAGAWLQRAVSRVTPDPFLIALGLTLVVMIGGAINLASSGAGGIAARVAGGWLEGFASTSGLAFALQMALVLVTGHAIATSPPVQAAVERLAQLPRTGADAALIVAAGACLASLIHWGLGAITGALLAREVARHASARGIALNYPLLGGAGYAGFAVWHGGLSGSAPLKAAEPGNFVEAAFGGVVPLTDTLLAPLNLLVTTSLVIAIPLLFRVLARHAPATEVPVLAGRREERFARDPGVVAFLQESRWVGSLVGLGLLAMLIAGAAAGRQTFDLNAVNLLFLAVGLLLQGSIQRYVAAIAEGAKGAGGIILQFPFYFGILGVMQATGLIETVSNAMLSIASPKTFPLIAFYSAGLVNLFVPSGGGQWAVQGEILARAGSALGVAPGPVIMAFSYGDAWTNMLQPFWALPLLGIMGLKARDVIGYTTLVCLLMGAVVSVLLLAFA